MSRRELSTARIGPETATVTLARLFEGAVDAATRAIEIAAETSATNGIEYIADWLNNIDAATDESIVAYSAWKARGRP